MSEMISEILHWGKCILNVWWNIYPKFDIIKIETKYVNDGNYEGDHKIKIAKFWFSLNGRDFSLLIIQTSEFYVANCMVGMGTSQYKSKFLQFIVWRWLLFCRCY